MAPCGKRTRPATWQRLGTFRVEIELFDRFDFMLMFPDCSASADTTGSLAPPVRVQYSENREE